MSEITLNIGSDGGAAIESDYPVLVGPSLVGGDTLAGLDRDWVRWAGPLVSIAILGTALWQLRQVNIGDLVALLPATALFWGCFALYFSANPISEYVIFRRLWRLPLAGIAALFRKLVSNNLLMGYLGEVYFYAWARSRAKTVAAPFGAVKDVAVLSALTGNVATLVMVALAAPLFLSMHLGLSGRTMGVSIAVMVVSSLGMMAFRRRLFSLRVNELWFVAAIHIARIVATIGLSALLWHLILPSVALGWWLLLSTLRQLVSRLPLVPNKDVVFAGIATMLVGHDGQIIDAVTLVASLVLFANLAVGAALGLAELLKVEKVA